MLIKYTMYKKFVSSKRRIIIQVSSIAIIPSRKVSSSFSQWVNSLYAKCSTHHIAIFHLPNPCVNVQCALVFEIFVSISISLKPGLHLLLFAKNRRDGMANMINVNRY